MRTFFGGSAPRLDTCSLHALFVATFHIASSGVGACCTCTRAPGSELEIFFSQRQNDSGPAEFLISGFLCGMEIEKC